MPAKVSIDDAAEYADLTPAEVARVLCYLVDDGWLFTSHVDPNPFDAARGGH